MGQKWNKFCLLFWKNWLLQIRHPVQTVIEILAPVLFSSLLVLIRSLVDVEEYNNGMSFSAFKANLNESFSSYVVGWSPYNPSLERIMNDVVINLGVSGHRSFNNSALLESAMQASTMDSILAGVQFPDSLHGNVSLYKDLDITIRFPGEQRSARVVGLGSITWFTNLLFPLYQYAGPRRIDHPTGGPPYYQEEGFLPLQQELSLSLISYFKETSSSNNFQKPDIWMQRYPYPRWINDFLLTALESFVSLIIMLSFVYTCINIVRCVTIEKEKQLKETMKIMGLPGWLHWTAWFVKEFIFLLISVILIVILVKVRWYSGKDLSVFTASDPTVLLVLFIPYVSSIITFSFLISVFFTRANVAATIAGMAWFLSYAPYMFMRESYISLSLSQKLGACIFANTAVAYGFQLMIMFEGNEEGFQWHNIWETASTDDNLVLGHVLIMLVFDTLIYLLIALYIEAVFPGKYGVPQKWYFLFTSSYWCGKSHYVVDTSYEPKEESNDYIEKDPENLNVGIQIKHLNKVYKNRKVAVRDLSLNLYEDQITVLLGHNGAGKTTTMSMLTGIFPPTRGTALIAGHDIRTDMDGVRTSLGLCPQSNVLFDELTVRDHLYFFSKLKGMKNEEIDFEIEKYLSLLELTDKRNAKASTLSGGMKRKLCVGIALCGDSKVVMLDEPSAGVDPSARRALWDLLQQQKKGRTLLLTTHFMDEADLLGDRIAIMAGGVLQCCGSSFFLKKKYGAGYHLVIDKMQSCNVAEVTRLFQKYIPDVIVESNVGSELTYLLDEQKSNVFEAMLEDLERNSNSLGIRSYGISLTTLEEVFMKVGADHGQEEQNEMNGKITYKKQDDSNSFTSSYDKITDINLGYPKYLTGCALWRNQFLVMFLKRVLSTYRSWVLMLIQILVPVLFLIIAMIVGRLYDRTSDLPSLPITLSRYNNPVTLISGTSENNYYNSYLNVMNSQNQKYIETGSGNLSEVILQETASNTAVFRRRYIVSASFNTNNTIVAWFSNIPYHGAPLSLNLVMNSIIKQELGSDYEIRINNYPLPFTIDTRLRQLANGNNMGFQTAFNLGFSMAFVSSFYIMFYVRERVINAKHLQFVSGVSVVIFWAASFLNDIITFIVTVICTLITLVCFQEDGFNTFDDINRIFSVFLFFIWAVLPLTYLASFGFSSPSSGFTRMTLINIFTGVAAYLVVQVLYTDGLDLEYVADILHWIFLLIPHYSFATGINKLNSKYSTNALCSAFVTNCMQVIGSEPICWKVVCEYQNRCCDINLNYYEWKDPGIGRNLTFSALVGAFLIVVLLLLEYRVFHNLKYFFKPFSSKEQVSVQNDADPDEDFDVFQEKQRIRNAAVYELENTSIALRDVTKFYGKFLAVNNICLTVDRYECFGLLGVNGAGKTTTFKMMTGDVMMSSGDAWVNGLSLKENMNEIYKHIGYCPQFDALLDNLTGRETLKMFCMLRGITYEDSEAVAVKLAQDFDFVRHLDKQVREYSGGNKRKLSTAVALIGDPLIIYLDEPSTGMDPATKRHLWNVLSYVREKGKCLVLTSHSMEECEALCTRLAIMVNGTFKCIGSVQHLKSKFSEGYTLQVKIRKTTSDANNFQREINKVKDFVETNFPGAILREEHQELLSFNIRNKSLQWSTMFGIMERGKTALNIEDYSLGQSNLEQVFLSFTKLQRESFS
ncbi:ATP-binding cassette sub-family A member 3 [Agrilus planipennis]|uniref:ATP-binding cassette sub-family A member 3 n=1 Tax=Agrilus planipennis TaxID=224129 RepID=A0A1W4X3J8_AGRPL|nr:ATP-binding cassette sub-family A member 3 [Agrilus planipennis]XP_018330700.1 ATP-binding cassette sub-family A member 3 [Agrilus planipennis]XP_018330701.1 ATP-binding cassette sub-family A member 3 [Agrilus planipennis]XP_018330702.1 ATP-binding cassette sub-family A member 3 [Agrilus planipennis]